MLMNMKVLSFKIPKPGKEALVYQEDQEVQFFDQLHQHEEIQISQIIAGSGSVIIGDSINNYEQGDILVIGANVPHVFVSDTTRSHKSVMYTLFFTEHSFGKDFFRTTDLAELEILFQDAANGIKVLSHRAQLTALFLELKHQNRIERIASLLRIMDLIQKAERTSLSTFVYEKKYTDTDGKRMNDVFQYTMSNFHDDISLEDVALTANMSKNAFCRYFKKRTNKTYFQFLIQIRVENAGRLLFNNRELPIASVSELCGFHNISNFNRKFKEIKGMTPTEFRKRMVN